MIVYWHFGGRGSWCHTIIEYIVRGCDHRMGIGPAAAAVVIVKADAVPSEEQLNADLAQIDRGVLIVTGNEEGTFRPEKIMHPRMKVWLQTPAPNQKAHRYLPWGWTPNVQHISMERKYNWSFAGQVTHQRRHDCVDILRKMLNHGKLVTTQGFSQGLSHEAYSDLLSSTRVAPCPSGPITVDSFRVWEALECGAIPVVDTISPRWNYPEYWQKILGEPFLPMVGDWKHFPAGLEILLNRWTQNSASVNDWWTAKKKEWVPQLLEDIYA